MLQAVLVEPKWAVRMTEEDYRGLTPLILQPRHPYGRFDLDLNNEVEARSLQPRLSPELVQRTFPYRDEGALAKILAAFGTAT